MVIAAPLFLFAQTRALRAFVVANAAGFQLMGVSVLAAYAASRALAAGYDAERVRGEVADARADLVAAFSAAGDGACLAQVLRAAAAAQGGSSAGMSGGRTALSAREDALAVAAAPMLRAALEAAVADARSARAGERALRARAEAAAVAAADLLARGRQVLASGAGGSKAAVVADQMVAEADVWQRAVADEVAEHGATAREAAASPSVASPPADATVTVSAERGRRGLML